MSPQVGQEAALTWQRPYPVRSPAATTGCCWSWKNAFLTMTKSVDLERRTPKCSVSTAMVRQAFRVEHMQRTKNLMENNLPSVLETASEGKSFMVCFCSSWQRIVMNPNCSAEIALELSLQSPCSGLLPIFEIAVFIWAGSGLPLCDWSKREFREVRNDWWLLWP